jgi:hypothetical protein
MQRVYRSLALSLLLAVGFTADAEPKGPAKPFEQVRLELLQLQLSSFGQGLSPYQLWLIHYWRGEYALILDTDSFVAAVESWRERGAQPTVDLSGLFRDTRDFYLPNLLASIQETDMAPHEKEFLTLFLMYILSQDERRPEDLYGVKSLADRYLAKYPDSPLSGFVRDHLQVEMPPLLWDIALPSQCLTFVGAFPWGDFGAYFSPQWGISLEEPVSYRNIVLTPAIGLINGSIQTPFLHDGETWSGDLAVLSFDLSVGYRLRLLPKLALLPQCGLGLLAASLIPMDLGNRIGFMPTASAGLSLEYYPWGWQWGLNYRLAAGAGYRWIADVAEKRFGGSELLLWLGWVGSFAR